MAAGGGQKGTGVGGNNVSTTLTKPQENVKDAIQCLLEEEEEDCGKQTSHLAKRIAYG